MFDLLIVGGIALAGASLIIGIIVIAVLWISKRRISSKLDCEYGERIRNSEFGIRN